MTTTITDNIKDTVRRYDMLRKKNITVALSGGADSVALLFALYLLKSELDIKLCACHVNHNLRGKESDGDEEYVRELCGQLEIPLLVYSVDVKSLQTKHTSLEETARDARYAFFERTALENDTLIATAHTASDNAETVFMNILRGTGLRGLCGIPPVRDYIIRPLIDCSRADTENFCRENNLRYVTDSTNLSTLYTRNKIRLEIMPRLLEINPSLISSVSRMTDNLTADNEFIEKIADSEKKQAFDGEYYDCKRLSPLDSCVLSRVAADILSESGVEPNSYRIKSVCEIICKGTGKVNLEKDKFALARKKKLKIVTEYQNYKNRAQQIT